MVEIFYFKEYFEDNLVYLYIYFFIWKNYQEYYILV